MKPLDLQDWKIIKQINIVSKNSFGIEITIGHILYERERNENYKYSDDAIEGQIKKLINYPKQDSFPSDEIDKIILDSVKEKYPNSYTTNYEIIFDTDSDRILHFIKRPKEEAYLEVRPDFSEIDINNLHGKEISIFSKRINIYQDFTLDSIKNLCFIGCCNYNSHQITYQRLKKIKFY